MSPINEILECINNLKKENKKISENDIISLLNATKKISNNIEFIDNLIFFYNNINPNVLNKAIKLTKREKEIVHLIGLGLLNQDIASKLKLQTSTVETHRKNMRKKLSITGNGKLLKFSILYNLQKVITTIK